MLFKNFGKVTGCETALLAERLAAGGNRVIMPDTRGHGASVPPDRRAYPPDALTSDALALIAHLRLTD